MNIPFDRNSPWNQHERIELLTEIIRQAHNFPLEPLLQLIRQLPTPSWYDLPLPRGRTVNQAQHVYYQMTQSSGTPMTAPMTLAPAPTFVERPMSRSFDVAAPRRPTSMEGSISAPSTSNRYPEILPRPTGLPDVLDLSPSGEPPRKKRGRPPKAETELRRAAARAQGLPYPPPRRQSIATMPSGPALAAQQAARAVMTPPPVVVKSSAPSETSSGKRKRGRPPRIASEAQSIEDEGFARGATRSPSRYYPDILSRDPHEGPSTFRAPRGQ